MIYCRSKFKQHTIRLQMVRYAQKNGIKPAARHFGCSKNTIRLWKRRYESATAKPLSNRHCGPHNIPHKTSQDEEDKIIEYRDQAPCYGAKRLKWFFDIKASEGAIKRILRDNGLTKKRRKKYQKKNDLRAVKATYKAVSHHQEDVKHLYDIANYYPQLQSKKLPKYQYTIRDTKSGLMFLGFSSRYNERNSELFTEAYFSHLKNLGVDLKDITIQTDNGSEFGSAKRDITTPGFLHTIVEVYGANHNYIPPGMCNANADVESVHNTIEEEFFDLEDFGSRKDFFVKAQAYQNFYNVVRPNFSKNTKTPMEIIENDRDASFARKVVDFPVFDIDLLRGFADTDKSNYLRGQILPALPGSTFNLIVFNSLWEWFLDHGSGRLSL
jgi:transposase